MEIEEIKILNIFVITFPINNSQNFLLPSLLIYKIFILWLGLILLL